MTVYTQRPRGRKNRKDAGTATQGWTARLEAWDYHDEKGAVRAS